MPTIAGRHYAVLDGLFSPARCARFIAAQDAPDAVLVAVDSALASYDRGLLVDAALAAEVWAAVRPLLPPAVVAAGAYCNDHFRFSKYSDGQGFDVHRDGQNQDGRGGRSEYTVNVFLNAGFGGGETDFLDEDREVAFRALPAPGRAALFDRHILHRGNVVRATPAAAHKYLLRTDVMLPPY
jgi:prolyl 4-hydroxylase